MLSINLKYYFNCYNNSQKQMGLLQDGAERSSWDINWFCCLNEPYLGIILFSSPCHIGEWFFCLQKMWKFSNQNNILQLGVIQIKIIKPKQYSLVVRCYTNLEELLFKVYVYVALSLYKLRGKCFWKLAPPFT